MKVNSVSKKTYHATVASIEYKLVSINIQRGF